MSDDLNQTPTRHSPYRSRHESGMTRSDSVSSAHLLPDQQLYDDEDMDDFQPIGGGGGNGGYASQGLGVSGVTQSGGNAFGRSYEDEDDEQTPVVPDAPPTHPSYMPAVPGAQMRGPGPSLHSPYRNGNGNPHSHSAQPYYTTSAQVPAASDPRFAAAPPHPQVPTAYPQYFVDPYTGLPTPYMPMTTPAAQPSTSASAASAAPVAQTATTYAPVQYASNVGGLVRSDATGDALLVRPKVKLTHQDKRNIVQLHRSNSSLRQEDIARQYGVDRSTISKIILQSHRWAPASDESLAPFPRMAKAVCGRFPAVEQRMHEWMDRQIASGVEVRDSTARDQAKEFAKEAGFPTDRFKASAKWLDKFKARRREQGKPTSTMPVGMGGYYPSPMLAASQPTMEHPYYQPLDHQQPGTAPLSRTQSNATLSSGSSEYAHQTGMTHENGITIPHGLVFTRSDTDLVYTPHTQSQESLVQPPLDTTPTSRQRSRSSPHGLDGGISPSSGKAAKPSPLNLQRQNSYHGYGGGRRPTPLSRSNTAASSGRRSRPGSLAASAFGITPLGGDEPYSPHSPASGSSGGISRNGSLSGHSRGRSGTGGSMGMGMTPFMDQMGVMTISPGMDTPETSTSSASSTVPMPLSVPPLTPITPGQPHPHYAHMSQGHAHHGHYAHAEYASSGYDHHASIHSMPYGTMPNKHYASPTYAYHYPPQQAYEGAHHPHVYQNSMPAAHPADAAAHTLHHPQPLPHLPTSSRYPVPTDFGPPVQEERWE